MPLPVETATDFQAQLEAINIHVTLDEQESSTYIANSNTGKLTGLFLLGWGADYPDVTNFLDYHFGAGCTAAFGACYPEIADPLTTGGQTSDEAARKAAYTEANNAILEQVPMVPISHAGFANAYLAGVGNQQISPLSNELLFRMTPPDGRENLVFMQSGEPGSLFCADESDGEALRACEQTMEPLYSFEENGTAPSLHWQPTAPATKTSPSGPARSARRDVPGWCDLRGQGRLVSLASSGMPCLRSTRARPVRSRTGQACGEAS